MRKRPQLLLCAALIAGCTSESEAPVADSSSALFQLSRRQNGERQPAAFAMATARSYDVTVTGVEHFPSQPPDLPTNMVIRTAMASVEVDSLEPAVGRLQELAARLGGYVANTGIETGKAKLHKAVIEVKIPAQRFDDAVSGLTPIGKLESINVSAQDVGEEFVDVNARMENARRLERRLIELLGSRAGRLKDVLAVEESLARVREEIERHEGRLRYLKAHTAMSTLTVTVHEPTPVVGDAGKSVMGEAVRQAWRNAVVLVSLAVQSLGVIIPLGLVAGIAWVIARRLRVARVRYSSEA